jgi:chemotaxis protein MotB
MAGGKGGKGGAAAAPTIIKKIKKGGHHGHHGGAWKVAYADFVTAMMAFFLLMWLLNTTTPEQKRGIADYFAPEAVSRSNSGNGAMLSGTSASHEGVDGAGQIIAKSAAQASKDEERTHDPSATPNKSTSDASGRDASSEAMQEKAAMRLRQAMQDMPDFAKLSRHILIDTTPEGARIQLIDQDGRSMFEPGSAEPTADVRTLLVEVSKVLGEFPNRISVSGHTDGGSFSGPGGYTNWDLSAARANATLRILRESGLQDGRVAAVVGKAAADPLYPENPHASANRRISIVLLKEAPVLPPGL